MSILRSAGPVDLDASVAQVDWWLSDPPAVRTHGRGRGQEVQRAARRQGRSPLGTHREELRSPRPERPLQCRDERDRIVGHHVRVLDRDRSHDLDLAHQCRPPICPSATPATSARQRSWNLACRDHRSDAPGAVDTQHAIDRRRIIGAGGARGPTRDLRLRVRRTLDSRAEGDQTWISLRPCRPRERRRRRQRSRTATSTSKPAARATAKPAAKAAPRPRPSPKPATKAAPSANPGPPPRLLPLWLRHPYDRAAGRRVTKPVAAPVDPETLARAAKYGEAWAPEPTDRATSGPPGRGSTQAPAWSRDAWCANASRARVMPPSSRRRAGTRSPSSSGRRRTGCQDLVPLRHARMAESPFAYYRGTPAVMAFDLATTPRTDIIVQASGDAHLSNFGLFASPERALVFDANDFDETLPGPWEWDVKRLAASVIIAGRANGFTAAQNRAATMATVKSYREWMARYAAMRLIDVWYSHLTEDSIRAAAEPFLAQSRTPAPARARLAALFSKARSKDALRGGRAQLTTIVDGRRVIRDDPPVIQHVELPGGDGACARVFEDYRATLAESRREFLERYRFADVALKVVGVGSVGTRCFVMVLEGRDEDDPLILQAKEATASVHGGAPIGQRAHQLR